MARVCLRFGRGASGRRVCRKWGSGRKKRGGRGLGEVAGVVNHCTKYKTVNGKRKCASFGRGGGKPSARARKAAGITRKFYETSTIRKRKPRKNPRGLKKVCLRKKRAKNGRMVCAKWSPVRKGSLKTRTKGTKRRSSKGKKRSGSAKVRRTPKSRRLAANNPR